MTAYTLSAFILGALAIPNALEWIRERWADVRDAMEENCDE